MDFRRGLYYNYIHLFWRKKEGQERFFEVFVSASRSDLHEWRNLLFAVLRCKFLLCSLLNTTNYL